MKEQIETLIQKIKEDYIQAFGTNSDYCKSQVDNWEKDTTVTYGKKYIKVSKNGSVWGFVVATDTDKQFKKGDLLKAASWKAPARNQARGNILDGDYSWVRWTGLEYIN